MNAAIEDYSISSLQAVVLDECHMIDDGYRGYLLELMATKLLCLGQPVQIIGMSATLTVRQPSSYLGGEKWLMIVGHEEYRSPETLAPKPFLRNSLPPCPH